MKGHLFSNSLKKIVLSTALMGTASFFYSQSNIVQANVDTFDWASGTYNILANDVYKDHQGNILPIRLVKLNETDEVNAYIEKVGIWPQGIDISPDGQLIISDNAVIPDTRNLAYRLCISGEECVEAGITLNEIKAGTIKTSFVDPICEGTTVEFENDTFEPHIVVTLNYTWQISYDNGVTWIDATDESANAYRKFDITVAQGKTLVRRKLRTHRSSNSENKFGFTPSLVMEGKFCGESIVNKDTFVWKPTSNTQFYNVVDNDVYNISNLSSSFIFTGPDKNATISKVGDWPNGFKLDENGLIIIDKNNHLPTTVLEYEICNINGTCQKASITFVESENILKGSPDVFQWSTTGGTFNILQNDFYKNGNQENISIIVGGSSSNATISKIGNWPLGININNNGELVIDSGVTIPSSRTLLYQICLNDGQCVVVPITFSQLDGGAIRTDSPSVVCEGTTVKIRNEDITVAIGELRYTWQISYNNGLKWENYTSETLNGVDALDFTVYEGEILVRRQVKQIFNVLNNDVRYAFTEPLSLRGIRNDISFIGSNSIVVGLNESAKLPTIQTDYPSIVTIKDQNGNIVEQGKEITFTEAGNYIYTVEAVNTAIEGAQCPSYSSILIQVIDLTTCNLNKTKVFATQESEGFVPVLFLKTGDVLNNCRSIDKDLSTYSTITVGIGALGLGTTWQNLLFEQSVSKGTPVTVKLGQEYSGLQLAGGVTVAPVDAAGNLLGPLQSIGEGALLDLLVGDNVFEHTFVPQGYRGEPIDYQGVRVTVGSLLAVANNAKIFGAYYYGALTESNTCNTISDVVYGAYGPLKCDAVGLPLTLNDVVEDVLWGVEDIGLGVASSLASVVDPYFAVDNDLNTYAVFNKAVAALNRQKLTVKLKNIARPGDELQILIGGFKVPLADIGLLSDFKIQRYLGDSKVGEEVSGDKFKILDLDLFAINDNYGGNRSKIAFSSTGEPYDRIEISYLSIVDVGLLGDYTYIYDVIVAPKAPLDFDKINDKVFCASDFLKVQKIDPCTNYDIEFAFANKDSLGNVIDFSTIENSKLNQKFESSKYSFFEFNKLYPQHQGNLYLKIQAKRNNCNVGDVQYYEINLSNCDSVVNPTLRLIGK